MVVFEFFFFLNYVRFTGPLKKSDIPKLPLSSYALTPGTPVLQIQSYSKRLSGF
jgi:hypothetical protein